MRLVPTGFEVFGSPRERWREAGGSAKARVVPSCRRTRGRSGLRGAVSRMGEHTVTVSCLI